MTDRFFTDEELVAFLDNEDDFAPSDEILLALKSDVALQKRLSALSFDPKQIAEGFSKVKPDAGKSIELPSNIGAGIALKNVAAMVLLALLIGGSLGFGFSNKKTSPSGWMEYVAAYQALYINATLSDVIVSDENKTTELARVTSAIGKDIKLASLQFTKEADYKRAQILGFEGKPLVQLAFLSRTGEPIALCIFRNGDADTSVTEQRLEGLQSASWSRDGYGYLLIGGKDEQLISQMASQFLAQEL